MRAEYAPHELRWPAGESHVRTALRRARRPPQPGRVRWWGLGAPPRGAHTCRSWREAMWPVTAPAFQPDPTVRPARRRPSRTGLLAGSATDGSTATCGICRVSVRERIPCPVDPEVKYTCPRRHRGGRMPRHNTVCPSRSVRHAFTRCNGPRPDSRRARFCSSASRTSPPRMLPHTSRIRFTSPLRMTSSIHSISRSISAS